MPVRPSWDETRPLSCPPLSGHDLYTGFETRKNRSDALEVDPTLLKDYSETRLLRQTYGRSIYLLDNRYILKISAPYIDVDAVVRTMRLASAVVPVPRVLKHGRSGNCCYIIMDRVTGDEVYNADPLTRHYPHWALDAKLEHQIHNIVVQLQRIGISHHDLYSHNLFVDRYLRVAAVIDWDCARHEPYGEEYTRRVGDNRSHYWDYIFSRNKPFGNGFVASPLDGASEWEPDDPYIPSSSCARDTNVDHILDPLSIPIIKPTRRRLVVLDGSDGTEVLCASGDHF